MGPVSATIAIDARRERVHRLIGDLGVRPAFTDHFIDELRLERLDPTGVGAAARFRIPERGIWIETVMLQSAVKTDANNKFTGQYASYFEELMDRQKGRKYFIGMPRDED